MQHILNLLCVPSHVLSTFTLSSLLYGDICVTDHIVINLLTFSIVSTGHKWIKVGWSWTDGVIVTGTTTPSLVESSITFTETPLTMREWRTASPTLVVVIVVVVVPWVVPQSSVQQSVLHVSVIHPHGSDGSCSS